MGDRVGSRVNLFQVIEAANDKKSATPSSLQNEDDYINDNFKTIYYTQEFSKTAMSVEGTLKKILDEVTGYWRVSRFYKPGRGLKCGAIGFLDN